MSKISKVSLTKMVRKTVRVNVILLLYHVIRGLCNSNLEYGLSRVWLHLGMGIGMLSLGYLSYVG